MRHSQTRPHHELDNEVAIADAPQAVLSNGRESQLFSQELPIYDERVPCECAASQWEDRYPRNELLQALEVGLERERVRQEEM